MAERQRQLHQLASELLTSQSDERRAIARELHDEFGQQLAAVRINLQSLLAGAHDVETQQRLSESLTAVKQLIEQIRSRALDLHPAILDDLGLGPALQWLCERKAQRLGISVEFQGDAGLHGLPADVELAGFRIAQEAILNAAKHSGTQRIELDAQLVSDRLHLQVRDHGRGFASDRLADAPPGQSLGLVSMRERAEQLGGTLAIHSERNVGTTVTVSIPVKTHGQD
jgi:signal transduction histidine kinase